MIDPTGDVIVSDEHDRLKLAAYRFAGEYNALLRVELDRRGMRACPAGEEWDSLWTALDKVAEELPREPNASFVSAREGEADFRLHAQKAEYSDREVHARMCSLPPQYGIDGTVVFEVTSGNVNQSPEMHPGFECRGGAVLR